MEVISIKEEDESCSWAGGKHLFSQCQHSRIV